MEAEVERFRRVGGAYRDTVVSLLRREYQRQRREREEGYARQIRTKSSSRTRRALDAIALFERFIAEYPSDPTYTPDAMFRLGELYFERDAIAFQEDMNAYLASATAARCRRVARHADRARQELRGDDRRSTASWSQRFPNYRSSTASTT